MTTLLRGWRTPLVLLAVIALIVVAVLHATGGPGTKTVSAEFDRTVGLYEGSEVRVMGLRVGTVKRIVPDGTRVRVDLEYDADYSLPADVKAVIVAPSVISDRFVQLSPGYVSGDELADGASIGLLDTRTPVELDESLATTTDLMTALGPKGANRHGALADTLAVMAKVLDGTGAKTQESLHNMSRLTDTLVGNSDEIETTVTQLSRFADTLAAYDGDVRRFNASLGRVADSAAAQSDQLAILLRTLATTLGNVESFVADNRALLSHDVSRLASVTTALLTERDALAEVIDIAPLAFTNLVETYDPQAEAVRTRANFSEVTKLLGKAICNELHKTISVDPTALCAAIDQALAGSGS